ncbi:MAG: protein-glutamate O-methyltransferase CheR [Pseudomonadota bacterium]
MKITPAEYDAFRAFLEKSCGIVLGDNKQYLLSSRLNRLMNEYDIGSFEALNRMVQSNTALRNRVLDAMTTNETSWFRDKYPFEILQTLILPEAAKRRDSSLRIWSAASSSGQEAYSINMIISEYAQKNPGALPSNVEIIGTDISSSMLEEARRGIYDSIAMSRGLTPERKERYFQKLPGQELWQVREPFRKNVSFRELNLLGSYSSLGRFDVVFCRNVLIYFSAEIKREILGKTAALLKPGGYLFLGGSESTANYTEAFEMLREKSGVVYRLRGASAAKT